jgi:choline-sulfatase
MVQKRCFYEMSSRVPLVMRFPNGYQAGQAYDEPVNLIDLLPTFLDLAGVCDAERLPMDGRSLMGLLDGSDSENREAFSETHADAMIQAPCFMLRQGEYKYTYIHGHKGQLFDLAADPGEWHNLVGNPDYADVEARMKARVLERFDPDAIAADVVDSYRKRMLIDKAMVANGTSWDYSPSFDPGRPIVERYLP